MSCGGEAAVAGDGGGEEVWVSSGAGSGCHGKARVGGGSRASRWMMMGRGGSGDSNIVVSGGAARRAAASWA